MKRFFQILLALFVGLILFTIFAFIPSINQWNQKPTFYGDPPKGDVVATSQFLIRANHPKVGNPSSFMSNGSPMKYSHVFIKDAAEEYPDITACLNGNKSGGTALNLLNFRWTDFKTDEEVRLCLFYVADILSSYDKMTEWFGAQGMPTHIFTASLTHQPPLTSMAVYGDFPEHIPSSCSFLDMIVQTFFGWVPWRVWNVRENASGVRINYMLDDQIGGIQVIRGSCLN